MLEEDEEPLTEVGLLTLHHPGDWLSATNHGELPGAVARSPLGPEPHFSDQSSVPSQRAPCGQPDHHLLMAACGEGRWCRLLKD